MMNIDCYFFLLFFLMKDSDSALSIFHLKNVGHHEYNGYFVVL